MSKLKLEAKTRVKYFVFAVLLIASLAPNFSLAVPLEPSIEFLTEWGPMPDRTMILRYGDHYYRHHILDSSPKKECNVIEVNQRKEISLIVMTKGFAWEYLISFEPVFYIDNGRDWEWVDELRK